MIKDIPAISPPPSAKFCKNQGGKNFEILQKNRKNIVASYPKKNSVLRAESKGELKRRRSWNTRDVGKKGFLAKVTQIHVTCQTKFGFHSTPVAGDIVTRSHLELGVGWGYFSAYIEPTFQFCFNFSFFVKHAW